MVAVTSAYKDGKGGRVDNGKYVRYTPEQVEALERLYHDCPKPSSLRRQQLIRECPILSNIEPKQIKVWFQNRRCREKQRKEASRLQAVNRKQTAMNKLLMEENDRLQKQFSQLVYENGCLRQKTQNVSLATTDNSCNSVVTTGQHQRTPQHTPQDASPSGLLSIAEETLTEFLSKATGTAVEWIQMPGMKPGPDSIGIIAISHGCTSVASRACSLVGLEPARVAEILKDRISWYRECRIVDTVNVITTPTGGTIELLYMQLYALTTLDPAREFWLLRYTSVMDDGSLAVCERSVNNTANGVSMPHVEQFVRAEMLPSGYLIRKCEGGGSILHIVNHIDLQCSEVLRPLYESSSLLAQKTTLAALRHLKQVFQETCHPNATAWGRSPMLLRSIAQRMNRGFNEAVIGFPDEGWSTIEGDGVDDIALLVNSSPGKLMGTIQDYSKGPAVSIAVLCAKASMLLQNVPPPVLLRFLREHRSEWADTGIETYFASAGKSGACALTPTLRAASFGAHVILPLAPTIENEEFMEVIRLENVPHIKQNVVMPNDIFLLQMYNGVDENAVGACAELIFAPIDDSFSDDTPLLPSGFRIIPLHTKSDPSMPNPTLDLASTLETGPVGNQFSNENSPATKSIMTIAFQFAFQIHLQETVATMSRQYIRSIISSVQRVATALSPSNSSPQLGFHSPPITLVAETLACWICRSYRFYLGTEILKPPNEGNGSILKALWHHSDAVICFSVKESPVFVFANQAGLDMLETSLVALQDMTLDKIFNDRGRKTLLAELPLIMQHGFGCLEGGVCLSNLSRPVLYERAVAWKVLNQEEKVHCLCIMFINWSFV